MGGYGEGEGEAKGGPAEGAPFGEFGGLRGRYSGYSDVLEKRLILYHLVLGRGVPMFLLLCFRDFLVGLVHIYRCLPGNDPN